MVQEVESEGPSETAGPELRKLLASAKLLEVADHCRQRLGERRYQELLGEQLRGGSGDIPETHAIITQLPFSAIVTTNYDKLLERAYTRIRGDLPKVVTARDRESLGSLLFSGGFFILKAHGDIDDAASLVLTARDYREIIHANPAFDALFSALLMTKSILFLGYSLGDPDFRLLLDRQLSAFGENIPERYAVMSDVGPVESDVLKRAANIKVLAYTAGEHAEVTVFLRTLQQGMTPAAEAAAPVAVAPAAAARLPAPPAAAGTGRAAVPAAGGTDTVPPPPATLSAGWSPITAAAPAEATLVVAIRDDRLEATLRTQSEQVSRLSDPLPWSLFYRSLATLLDPARNAATPADNYRDVGARLGKLLPGAAVAALPPEMILTIDAARELANVPWKLALCADDQPLAAARPITRAMAPATAAARGLPGMRRPLQSLVIGDPGTNPTVRLPGAYDEAVAVAGLYVAAFGGASCTALCREAATLNAVVDALSAGTYDVIHFAGHAWFDEQESYLSFDEGEQVTASELRTLLGRRPPALLILNSHYTAFLPQGMRPAELANKHDIKMPPTSHIGFTSMAIATGVGAFIGCFSSPSDLPAKQFGVAVHRELLGGAVLAHAVRSARRETLAANPGDVSALQYVLAGHAHYQLT